MTCAIFSVRMVEDHAAGGLDGAAAREIGWTYSFDFASAGSPSE